MYRICASRLVLLQGGRGFQLSEQGKERLGAGYAGIELQGIIDEYQKQNSDFFTTGLNEKKKYKIFDTVEKEIQDYNQYRKSFVDLLYRWLDGSCVIHGAPPSAY